LTPKEKLFSKDIQPVEKILRKILILFSKVEQSMDQAPRVKTKTKQQMEKVRTRKMQQEM